MARITVEDCLEHVDNRFELVLVATKRARQLALGAEPMVSMEKDKPTVLALREIAEGLVTADILNEVEEPEISFDINADGEAVTGDLLGAAEEEVEISMEDDELAALLKAAAAGDDGDDAPVAANDSDVLLGTPDGDSELANDSSTEG